MSETATEAREGTRAAASDAAGQTKQVAATAQQEATAVAQTAKEQAHEVVGEAKAQARNVIEEAKTQVRAQADGQTSKLATSMRSFTNGLHALREGRPEEAGAAGDYVRQAAFKLDDVTTRLETRGFDGMISDLQRFARRRPGAFLAGAVAAGFLAGRLFRSVRDDDGTQPSGNGMRPLSRPMGEPVYPAITTTTMPSPELGTMPSPLPIAPEPQLGPTVEGLSDG